jgi:hypothetical protein
MRRSRRPVSMRLALLAAVLSPPLVLAQTDAIPPDQLGVWVPAKSDCKSSTLKLELAPKTMTLTNGKDRVSKGNVGLSFSYFGNSYQGIKFAAMADWDKTQPYVVILNAKEKKGQAEIYFNDAALKKRFPLEGVLLKRCASTVAPAAK